MNETFSERKIHRIDLYFSGGQGLITVALAVNIALKSIALLYGVILLFLGGLLWVTRPRAWEAEPLT